MSSDSPSAGLGFDVAQRILQLREESERTVEFARRVGLSPQVLYNYAAGLNGASLEAVAMVAHRTNVSPRWLLTGQGPRAADTAAAVDPYQEGVKETALTVLEALDRACRDCGLPGVRVLAQTLESEGEEEGATRSRR